MPELELLLLQMATILAVARISAALCRRIGQPAVIGEMAAGILLGPSLLGRIAPTAMAALFPPDALGGVYLLSQVGLVLFMFVVGLEVRPGAHSGSAKPIVAASQASIAAPFLLGGALAWILHPTFGDGADRLPFVLFLGAAMGVTAFPVLARILADRGLLDTRVGVFAISCAAVDDLTAWGLLAVVTVIARPGAANTPLAYRFACLVAYIAIMIVVIRPLLRRILPPLAKPGPGRFGAVVIFVLLSAWTTETIGVHALFGAFLAGLVMPKGGELQAELKRLLETPTVVLLLPLFFAYTGLRTSIGLVNTPALWLLAALILVIAVGSKLLVSAAVVRAGGMSWREALAVGVLVNTKGLVELVVLNVGLDLHIISPTLFSIMVLVALATTVMTTPLLDRILPR